MSDIIVEKLEKYGLSQQDRPRQLFSKVGIVGCGSVGQAIAILVSSKELEVHFIELSEEKITQAFDQIEKELNKKIEHWGLTSGEKRSILSRIHGYVGYEHLKGCDLVIETIRTKKEQQISSRKEVFKNIEKYVSPETIIATNSTTVVVTELAAELEHKERCIGLHFFTNTPDAKIIEVVKGLYTSDEVYEKVCKFVKLLDKEIIPVQESPGLISIRLMTTLINEACQLLMEGISSKENIDKTMKEGLGMPLGPFEIADKAGLDKVVNWMDSLYNEFGEKKYKPSPVLMQLVRANRFGLSTGEGFYKYDKEGRKIS